MTHDPAADTLILHLTGPFRATLESGDALTGLSRRAQALLAYLAQQPAMRAERGLIVALLWSDRAEEQARASLRQELSVLRRTLPEGMLMADRQAVWLDRTRIRPDLSADGVFLQGFDLASEGFEDWLRDQRARDLPSAPAADAPPARTRPGLAVLPFEELGAHEDDMFAVGVVEEITGALSRVHDFHVIARQSAFALRGEKLDAPETARRLGVAYLVEGSVQRAGERVRISVQLVAGEDGRTLWSQRFDDRMDDLFDLQDRIAAQMAGQISPNLRSAEIDRARTRPPQDRTAYELTLTALPHFWAHRKSDNARAIELLDQALARDPDYGPALAYKGWAVAQQPVYLWTDRAATDDRAEAIALAEKAAQGDLTHTATLVAIAATLSLTTTDLMRSDRFLDRALSIDPGNAWGWMRRGWNRLNSDRPDEASADFERAQSLSPLDPFLFNMQIGQAIAQRELGNLDRALALLQDGLANAPGLVWAKRILAAFAAEAGEMGLARAAAADLLAQQPDITVDHMISCFGPNDVLRRRSAFRQALIDAGLPPG